MVARRPRPLRSREQNLCLTSAELLRLGSPFSSSYLAMLNRLKGRISATLLAAKSNHTVSRTSLYWALGLAMLIALSSALFAFAQWQVGENLARIHRVRTRAVEERVAASASMASQQANAHRATLNVLLSRDDKELEEAEALRRSNLQGYLASSRQLGENKGLGDAAEELRILTAQYDELSARAVGLFREGRRQEALDLRVGRLRGTFNRWQSAHSSFSSKVAQTEADQKKDYEAATSSARRLLVGLLVAPFALIVFGIAVIAAMLGFQRFRTADDSWLR